MPNLDGMAEHVAYEVDMLVETARRLTPPLADTVTNNAHLESFLIHARSLDDFLRRLPAADSAESDDVFARHYSGQWKHRGSLADGLRKDINKRVAHLTDTRVGKSEDVAPAVIARSLLLTFCDFAAQLGAGKWPELDGAAAVARCYLAESADAGAYPGAIVSTTTNTVVTVTDFRKYFEAALGGSQEPD